MKTILVIEDDFGLREAMHDFLDAEGFKVLLASNGREGLKTLRENARVDLILLDLTMPIMDGNEFLTSLASENPVNPVPVVVMSAVAETGRCPRVLTYLKKPVDLDTLRTTVDRYAL